MKQVRIAIGPNGDYKHIYADELLPLDEKFNAKVSRASDVYFNNHIRKWCIRVDGHVLEETFDTRQEALDFEVSWLEATSLHVL
jgi:hypothetical protein